MVWLLVLAMGVLVGANGTVVLVTIAAALLGIAIAAHALLTGIGLLQLPVEIATSAVAFDLGLVAGLAMSLAWFRHN